MHLQDGIYVTEELNNLKSEFINKSYIFHTGVVVSSFQDAHKMGYMQQRNQTAIDQNLPISHVIQSRAVLSFHNAQTR